MPGSTTEGVRVAGGKERERVVGEDEAVVEENDGAVAEESGGAEC